MQCHLCENDTVLSRQFAAGKMHLAKNWPKSKQKTIHVRGHIFNVFRLDCGAFFFAHAIDAVPIHSGIGAASAYRKLLNSAVDGDKNEKFVEFECRLKLSLIKSIDPLIPAESIPMVRLI